VSWLWDAACQSYSAGRSAEQLYDACEALGIQPSYVRGGAWRPAVVTGSAAHKLARRLLFAKQPTRIKGHGERYPVPHPDQARRLVDAAQGLQAGKGTRTLVTIDGRDDPERVRPPVPPDDAGGVGCAREKRPVRFGPRATVQARHNIWTILKK
jgi:hypothetical protein